MHQCQGKKREERKEKEISAPLIPCGPPSGKIRGSMPLDKGEGLLAVISR